MQANVFRFAPETGHQVICAFMSTLTLQGSRTVGAVIPFTPPDVVLIVQQPARAV
jgi:hypothetical protein